MGEILGLGITRLPAPPKLVGAVEELNELAGRLDLAGGVSGDELQKLMSCLWGAHQAVNRELNRRLGGPG